MSREPGHRRSAADQDYTVRRLVVGDWQLLRQVRLRALREDPRAFLATHGLEAALAPREWIRRVEAATWMVAETGTAVVGLLCSGSDGAPESLLFEAVWVDPDHRGRKVLRLMVDALLARDEHQQVKRLRLWVVEDNYVARRVYERLGFTWTGECQLLPGRQRRYELRYQRLIG